MDESDSMKEVRDLQVILCISRAASRERFAGLLRDLRASGQLADAIPAYRLELACAETRQAAVAAARAYLSRSGQNAAVLAIDTQETVELGPDLRANCAIALISDRPRRPPDVDRVIDLNADAASLLCALKLLTDKLTYTARPSKREERVCPEIRLIRRQRELMEYFQLRHRIYKIMGYLDEETEKAPTRMEINWCDKISLHAGAFVDGNGSHPDRLVGTARVVVAVLADDSRRSALLRRYDEWSSALANSDPVLQRTVAKGVLPLQLPIFQSQKSPVFREALRRRDVCGELSRVIVVDEYRGTGLSRRLVEFALDEAAKLGVTQVFLECLAIHEPLYQRLGFTRLEGVRGNVISVNQTMIGMARIYQTGQAGGAGA